MATTMRVVMMIYLHCSLNWKMTDDERAAAELAFAVYWIEVAMVQSESVY